MTVMTFATAHAAARLAFAAIATFSLVACGGGRDASVAVADAMGQDPATAVAKPGDGDTTWIACAAENGRCDFTGIHAVRYGADGHDVVRELAGPVACDNATFGDPIVGTVKSCAYAKAPVPTWTACAVENGRCAFDGTRTVRYGANDRYATRDAQGGVDCSNGVFGDPIVGTVKSCWLLDVTVASVPVANGDPCVALPPLPVLPARYNVVTSFCVDGRCATPDDDTDDTDAIDRAIDASAGTTLVFPPGRYLIKRSLRVKRAGVTLWGPGATIHATNPDDQSIIVEADGVSIYSFRLTAVTQGRGSRAEHTRIAIYGPAGVNPVVHDTVIRDNRIVPAGAPGTDLANSATAAGIFVNAADGFLIAGNTVERTLADGIHLTGGARNGRVVGNTVRETGDDMIAMVSYAYPDPMRNVASTIEAGFAAALEKSLDRDILVANNTLSGNYWGRGIAVVGGRDITIRDNTLQNVPYGAAVLVAREAQSGTFGVRNVLVEHNTVLDEQTLEPPYDVDRKFASNGRTGHGAVEVHASTFVDELSIPALKDGFAVRDVAVRSNRIERSATPAVRAGVGSGTIGTIGSRASTGNATIAGLSIEGNTLADIRIDPPVQIFASAAEGATCSANLRDGAALASIAGCAARTAPAAVTGASLVCKP